MNFMKLLRILSLVFIFNLLLGLIGDVYLKRPLPNLIKIETRAMEALHYCKEKGYNTSFCILIDLSIHSGLNRLFLWNYSANRVEYECLVSHGCGGNKWASDESRDTPKFSNNGGTHCSSLGKYRVGARGYSQWGININYLLYGLESSNSNAIARTIVFHSWSMIPNGEIFPIGCPEGWGCPAVSNSSMTFIDNRLKGSKKPVLMWIYN